MPHRLVAPLQVLLGGARQAGNSHRPAMRPAVDHVAGRLGHRRDGLKVALRRDREARLAHVHAQPRQLLGNLDLFRLSQRGAGRLLAVAQGGVEDDKLLGRPAGGSRGEGARRCAAHPAPRGGGPGSPRRRGQPHPAPRTDSAIWN
eukprot:scaffold15242_cov138-Isochrysis_galbana.AAC.1